ncbi:hypothetical protein F5X97DRAFT_320253 [Nemania serpens]|nr:hypothetical protein F5X97DRAFT_320253 [Nemania serpens]
MVTTHTQMSSASKSMGVKERELEDANGTTATRHDPDQYIVELEMFHQLHCLKWLRASFWSLNDHAVSHKPSEEFPQREYHKDHCIDYLRQVIMCHGDMTPITFEWIPKDRDTTGLEADGRHVNVDLQHPESFD